MKTKVLGKKSKKLNFSGKDLLDSIPRNRKKIEHGIDIWNVYDFMFKDKKEVPHLKVLEIIIPSNSKFIVESKSMKLYLNSFYDIAFTNQSEILKKIKRDLKSLIKDDVKLRFIDKFSVEPKNINLNQSNCETIQRRQIIKFNGFSSSRKALLVEEEEVRKNTTVEVTQIVTDKNDSIFLFFNPFLLLLHFYLF